MPKFLTYQRPAPVSRQNWNHAPDRKSKVPIKAPEPHDSASPTIVPPALAQLIRKE